jgi:tetratricopeptide (TPR) repeat protein
VNRPKLALMALAAAILTGWRLPAVDAQNGAPSKAQEEAVSKAQAALADAKSPAEKSAAEVDLGRALYAEGEEKKAEDQYHAALDLDASNASAHLELGRLEWGQRHLDKAEAEFQQVMRLAPKAGAGYAAEGQLLAATGHDAQARPLLEKADELDSRDWPSRYQLALILEDGAESGPARELLNEVIKLQPDYMPAREQLALDRFRHGDAAGAVTEAQSMLAEDPKSPEGHRIMALSYFKQRQYEASLAECALALQDRQDSLEVLALQALDLWELDRKKEARQVVTDLARDPSVRAKLDNAETLCRWVVCGAGDIAAVSDFLRRNRYILNPPEP